MLTIMRYSEADQQRRSALMRCLDRERERYQNAAQPYIDELVQIDQRTPVTYIMELTNAPDTEAGDSQDEKDKSAGSPEAGKQRGSEEQSVRRDREAEG